MATVTATVREFTLIIMDTEHYTDEEVEKIFYEMDIEMVEDMQGIMNTMFINRELLHHKINSEYLVFRTHPVFRLRFQ